MDWPIITAISTGVIAVFAVSNFFLALSIRNVNKRHQKEFTDTLQAVVIATLCSTPRTPTDAAVRTAIAWFKDHYKGETQIFSDDK